MFLTKIVVVALNDHLLSLEEQEMLNKLDLVSGCIFDSERGCMLGTRVELLKEIDQWIQSPKREKSFFWIRGLAGSGKSAIATSVASQAFSNNRLGGCFFCRRDKPQLRDAQLIIPALAFQLASACKPYGKTVYAAIRDKTSICNTRDLRIQYEALVEKPLRALGDFTPPSPLVIIVDAVDECETGRQQLVSYLQRMASIVPWLTVLMTSRPDSDIQAGLEKQECIDCDLRTRHADDDISLYIEKYMKEHFSELSGTPEELKNKVDQMTKQAQGLFIWATTACKYIHAGIRQMDRLLAVLDGKDLGPAISPLNKLYFLAMTGSFDDSEQELPLIQQIMGAVVAVGACEPLSESELVALLNIPLHDLRTVIEKLSSVLYIQQPGGAIRICHPTFAEFVNSTLAEKFYVRPEKRNHELSVACLGTLLKDLKFNIYQLTSSHEPNKKVLPNLDDRTKHRIGKLLRYSCLYWANHVCATSRQAPETKEILVLLDSFIHGPKLLFWMECLGLIGKLDAGISCLLDLVRWISVRISKSNLCA